MDAASGAESVALLNQLPLVYVGDDYLIDDAGVRRRVLSLHCAVINFGRETKNPQIYSPQQLEDLNEKWRDMTREFWWFTGLLGDQCPGDGMAIPKYHDLSLRGAMIQRYGSLVDGSTSTFERRMKHVKFADALIGRSRRDDGMETLYVRTVLNELNSAEHPVGGVPEVTSTEKGERKPCAVTTRFGAGQAWLSLLRELKRGDLGPRIEPEILSTMMSFVLACEYFEVSSGEQIVFSETLDVFEPEPSKH